MTYRELINLCLAFPDTYEDHPFDGSDGGKGWALLRHRGNRKSYAFVYERDGLCVNLKCDPMRADFLRQALPGVTPAYHMNKEHWNTVRPELISPEDFADMLRHSYTLTMPKGKKRA